METIIIQKVTITGPIKHKGSNRIAYNVSLNGVPFGAIWTFKAKGEIHPFHAMPLNGEHKTFDTYKEAETFMRSAM